MDVIYKVGVTIGIIVMYTVVTWGLAFAITAPENDEFRTTVFAWGIGLVAFVILAVFTLTKFGLWKV